MCDGDWTSIEMNDMADLAVKIKQKRDTAVLMIFPFSLANRSKKRNVNDLIFPIRSRVKGKKCLEFLLGHYHHLCTSIDSVCSNPRSDCDI